MRRLAAALGLVALVCPAPPAAYRRLTQAIGALDEQIFAVERYTAGFCP
jgi:hypothetical protein